MIYITVMRINSVTRGRGINIFLHRPAGLDVTNPWSIVDNPGPKESALDQREVAPGGNRVEAYLDLFFNECDYSPDRLDWALGEVAREIEQGTRNPARIECAADGRVIVRVVFSVNLGLEDLASKRRVFNELSGALMRWERQHAEKIAGLTSGGLQAAG